MARERGGTKGAEGQWGKGRRLYRGRQLGKYRLVKRLGEGGFSEVWKAKDTVEEIWVALKVPHLRSNGEVDNESLLKEVRLSSQLHHRHLLPPKNADVIEGRAVMATELSAGTLADKSRPMSVRRLVGVMAQVLEGLAFAHRHRMVHCDVTPYNIFLFPDGRAALGDFGIGIRVQGRPRTVDEFGTPGYVAPEQAYGRPTYRSDCFSVGLVMWEYLTGVLPRWPFRWPLRGHKRLEERVSGAMVRLLRKSLEVDPAKRFARGDEMLSALLVAAPVAAGRALGREVVARRPDWRRVRREAFRERYGRVLGRLHACVDCGEPVAEAMAVCPWCGSERNVFDERTEHDAVCPRCRRGVRAEWRYCPWCWGAGFAEVSERRAKGVRSVAKCGKCGEGLEQWMRYCPWCHAKLERGWQVRGFPEVCGECGGSVDTEYWRVCPWCGVELA